MTARSRSARRTSSRTSRSRRRSTHRLARRRRHLGRLDQRTSESVELSAVFLLYMILAALIAAIGIFLDSPILVVGAMVVGPELGPVAGLCVALVQRRGALARRSATALGLGFPLAILATV